MENFTKWKMRFLNNFRTIVGYTRFFVLPTIEVFKDHSFDSNSLSISFAWLFWEVYISKGWWDEVTHE